MNMNKVKCEVVDVKTDDDVCPGMAKTRLGETYILGARTPADNGICCSVFSAIAPMKQVYMYTQKMDWEKKDHFDITCPHGSVVFRISRMSEKIPM